MPVHQTPGLIKPTQKPIREYYQTLQEYGARGVRHEGALETAFQRLLADTARRIGWTLIPKHRFRKNGDSVYPDGTILDSFSLPMGYWEAKDTCEPTADRSGSKGVAPTPQRYAEWPWAPTAAASLGVG